MEGRKRSGMLKKSVYNMRKRLVAFALAAAMVCTNVGADLNAAYAATSSSESVTFEMTGSQLVTAIEEAIENGNVISPGDLDFTNGDIAKFESLFYGEGKVLEVFPDPDGGSMDAELRVFVRLPEDADDMYMVTGDEEIIFLYVNNGEDTVSFSTTIYDDEGGKLKSTKAIRVKSFEDAFGEEEINYISKPTETTAPAEDNGPAMEESTAPTESETAAPEEGTTAAPEEGTTVAPEEGTTVAPEETPTAAEESSSEAPSESETESATEAEQTEPETTEAPETTEEKAQEPENPEAEVAEPENTTGEPVASITRHYAPIVADNEEDAVPEQPKADAAEEHVEEPKETTEAEVETEEKEPETTEKATEATEPTEVTDSAESTDATEETSAAVPDATTEAGGEDVNPGESTPAEETTTAPEEVEETTTAVETPAVTEPVQTGTPSEVTKPEVVEDEEKVNKADTNNLVGMGYCSTAKVYTTSLKELKIPIPEREIPTEYTLYINHILSTQFGQYRDEQEITLYDNDFVDGIYVLNPDEIAYQRDGLEVVTQALTITQDSFISNDNIAAATIDYKVAEGWKAVPNYDLSFYQRSIYIGTFEDVSIVPDDKTLVVKINFLNEQGVPVEAPYAVEAEEHGEGTGKTYSVEFTLPEISGYEPRLEDDNVDFIIENGVLKNVHDFTEAGVITVDVIYIAGDTSYIVKHLYQTLDGTDYVEDTEKTQELHGKIDSLTEAMEIPTEGFTVQDIAQQKISTEGTVVEVKYDRNDYTLLYDTTGGSYVPSVTEKFGTKVTLVRGSNVPTRTGYTFDGWYLDEDLTQKADDTLTLESDVRVYAKWNGAVVGYKVVYLTENADDNNYSYAGTVDTLRAKAGSTVKADAYTTKPSGFDTQHFSFKESTSEIVAADGSTVITVKYSRNVYTITFEGTSAQGKPVLTCKETEHTHSISGGCYRLNCNTDHYVGGHSIYRGCYDLICRKNEHRHSERNGCYTNEGAHGNLKITAKYGAFIGDQWNALVGRDTDFAGSFWYWDGDKTTSYQEIMPGENKSLKKYSSSSYDRRELFYYIEDPEGDIDYKGKTFSLHNEIVFYYSGNITYNEEFYDMSGSGYDRYASTVSAWHDGKMNGTPSTSFPKNPINFYYTLHSYKLSLVNGDRLNEEYIPYLTDISDRLFEPDYNPLGDGTFEGWYLDPTFQQPYEGDMIMPKGLVLYAKWNPVTYAVTFKDSMDETNIFDIQDIPRGKTVNPFIPDKPGFIFKGWFSDKECTQAFDYATQINDPKEIYAKWETSTTTTYTVIFQTSDGTVIKKDEAHSGKVGATIIVNAIKPEGEYSAYIPDAITKTHVLDPNPDNNVIIFVYTPVTDLSYKVQYKYGDVVVFETEEIHSEANYVKVTADMSQILPKGYKSSDGQLYKWVTLSTGENIVVFNVEPATYSIEYDLKGGSMKAGEVNPATYVPADLTDEGILLYNPIKDGYTFTGWKLVTGTNPDNDHNPLATVIGKGSYGNIKFEAGYIEDENGNNIPDTEETRYAIEYVAGENGSGDAIAVASDQLPDQDVTDLPTREGNVVSFNGQEIRAVAGFKFSNMTVTYEPSEVDASYVTAEKDGNGDVNLIRTNNAGAEDLSAIKKVVVTVNYEPDAEQWTTVGFDRGEHGTFSAEADAENTVITIENQLIGGDFPTEPGITAAEGWVFTGWNPVLPETVEAGGLVYTAQYAEDENGNQIPDTEETRYVIEYVSGKNGTGGRTTVISDQLPDQDVTALPVRTGNVVSFDGQDIIQPLAGYKFKEMIVTYEPSELDEKYVTAKKDENGDVILVRTNNISETDLSEIKKVVVLVNYEWDAEQWTTVGFNRGEHGTFSAEADAEKTIITIENQLIGRDFPTEPGITVAEGWMFTGWNPVLPETVEAGGLVYTAQYAEDIKGGGEDGKQPDNIPDKYQTIFWYESADTTKGTVSVTNAEVHTFRDDNGNYTEKTAINPNGATADPTDGNAFDYWTDNDTKDSTIDMNQLKSKTYLEDTTFTAYFDADEKGKGPDGKEPDGVPDKYETIFVYKSADVTTGTVDADPLKAEVHVFKDADGNYTDKRPVNPNGAIATPLDGFAFDYWTDSEVNDYTPDMSKMKTNTYLVDTTFIAYFDVDEIGIEVPNEPDGVPDKYQIKFQYVSEDTNRGTVSGRVTEVKTVYEIVTGEDGNDHRELKPASPDANVTVSSLGSYLFNNWTDGSRGYANADEIRAAEFTQSTTFTAQFRFNGGGGTGPGGGGGGPSGNTEGNGRYNPSTVGPGTTTITPEDVPLAPLPESPVDVTLIDDGEVPLAPLPKTGQTSMRTTLTMMLSGIFVAVTALSKKRKEEDS